MALFLLQIAAKGLNTSHKISIQNVEANAKESSYSNTNMKSGTSLLAELMARLRADGKRQHVYGPGPVKLTRGLV